MAIRRERPGRHRVLCRQNLPDVVLAPWQAQRPLSFGAAVVFSGVSGPLTARLIGVSAATRPGRSGRNNLVRKGAAAMAQKVLSPSQSDPVGSLAERAIARRAEWKVEWDAMSAQER